MSVSKIVAHVTEHADTYKLSAAGGIVLAALFLFYALSDHSLLLRVIGLLLAGAGAVFIILKTATGQETWEFTQGARTELHKIVWPTRQETTQTTLVVVVVVVVMGILLWLLDVLLFWLVRSIVG